MNRSVATSAAILLIAGAACSSCANVDVHFGADEIDGGLGYWKYGVGGKPIYSFYLQGDTFSVREGSADTATYTVTASACAGLNDATARLLSDVEDGIVSLLNRSTVQASTEILADAPRHRLVYQPVGQPDRVEISGFEEVAPQSWIQSAQRVRKIIRECADD
jgi:hypothetical protein